MTKGWSTPQVIFTLPTRTNGYTYSFHAYPNYDPTHKVITLSWSEYQEPSAFYIGMANVTFT
jgi:hypothetical protein